MSGRDLSSVRYQRPVVRYGSWGNDGSSRASRLTSHLNPPEAISRETGVKCRFHTFGVETRAIPTHSASPNRPMPIHLNPINSTPYVRCAGIMAGVSLAGTKPPRPEEETGLYNLAPPA
jgi:hypothetical protein